MINTKIFKNTTDLSQIKKIRPHHKILCEQLENQGETNS